MPPVIIDNPILNSPYHEPARHFRFDANNQITNKIDTGRRGSSYFLPIAAPKKTAPTLFDETRAEEARLWITGLEAVQRKLGVKAVFDFSATPFYLKGSGYPEGTLFPWVVSDFSLMDAIERGIVKIPRVPIADNAMTGDYPKYRNLWADIRDAVRDLRRGPEDAGKPPLLPGLLEGALKSLYDHYAARFAAWEADEEARANGSTPPVFIVVCNNTNVSKAVFDTSRSSPPTKSRTSRRNTAAASPAGMPRVSRTRT